MVWVSSLDSVSSLPETGFSDRRTFSKVSRSRFGLADHLLVQSIKEASLLVLRPSPSISHKLDTSFVTGQPCGLIQYRGRTKYFKLFL